MIPRFKKILYATDLSENSAYAFRYAVNSAQNHGAKIHILHVLEEINTAFLLHYFDKEEIQAFRAAGKEKVTARIQERLKIICEKEFQDAPECRDLVESTEIVEGDPSSEILRKAEELGVDLVVMGTHGKGLLAHAFLGSVAEKVLQRTKIPVLTIPIPKETDIKMKV